MSIASPLGASFSIAVVDLLLIVVHLVLYVLLRGKETAIRKEIGIFLYHVAFFIFGIVGATVASIFLDGALDLRALAIVASLQGIYSMTFLEAWSLSEGSYSYSILRQISQDSNFDPDSLKFIGADKRTVRSEGLVKRGLLGRTGEHLALTVCGWVSARLLAFALWLINVKRNG